MFADMVVVAIVIALVVLAVRKLVSDRRAGRCTGCSQAGHCCGSCMHFEALIDKELDRRKETSNG